MKCTTHVFTNFRKIIVSSHIICLNLSLFLSIKQVIKFLGGAIISRQTKIQMYYLLIIIINVITFDKNEMN